MDEYVKKLVNLEQVDVDIVTTFASKLGASWTAALRIIIRDWNERIASETAQKIEATK
jgi:hypothetical protein